MSPEQAWAPWIAELDIYRQDCAHVDIISPVAFRKNWADYSCDAK